MDWNIPSVLPWALCPLGSRLFFARLLLCLLFFATHSLLCSAAEVGAAVASPACDELRDLCRFNARKIHNLELKCERMETRVRDIASSCDSETNLGEEKRDQTWQRRLQGVEEGQEALGSKLTQLREYLIPMNSSPRKEMNAEKLHFRAKRENTARKRATRRRWWEPNESEDETSDHSSARQPYRGGGGGGFPSPVEGQRKNKLKSLASTCLMANKLDQLIEEITKMEKDSREELPKENREFRRKIEKRIQTMEERLIKKLDETEKKKEARFSQMEEKIRENIDTVFNEKWDLMNRRVASLWKETTKDVLQELRGINWSNKVERSNSGSDQTNSNSGSHGEERGLHPDIEDDDIENMFSGGIGGGVDGGDNGGSGDISSGFKRRPDGVQERSLQGDRNLDTEDSPSSSSSSSPSYDRDALGSAANTQLILQGYDLIYPACWPKHIPMPNRIPIHFTALSNTSNLNYETVTDSSGLARDVKVRLDLNALLCDITTTAGAPWLKIMRKEFGSETFHRDWSDYKFGFWDRTGEFWLGNEILHNLTSDVFNVRNRREGGGGDGDRPNDGSWDLLIKMKWRSDLTGYYPGGAYAQQTGYAVYRNFRMSSETSRYSIDFGPRRASRNVPHARYDGFYNHKDQFRIHGWPFTTRDRDNDDRWKENCAGLSGGGYWHSGDCCYTCLTTRYPHWYDGTGAYSYMQWIEMGIRPAE